MHLQVLLFSWRCGIIVYREQERAQEILLQGGNQSEFGGRFFGFVDGLICLAAFANSNVPWRQYFKFNSKVGHNEVLK